MESKNLSLSASMEKEGFLDQLNNFLTKSGWVVRVIIEMVGVGNQLRTFLGGVNCSS